ncbi:hypothetical protein V6Z11_D04G102500 [Gossypium hirsutum]
MRRLVDRIDRLIDGPILEYNTNELKVARTKLGHLYLEEEKYLRQRSRIQWLKDGDMNTWFFHVQATRRNKRNRIEGLFNPDGVWVKGPSDVCGLAKDYFLSLFIYETCGNFEGILDQISRCISPEMNLLLDGPVTDREIFEAFNQMDPRKAPGIDRLSSLFYNENWDVLSKKVIQYCHEILKGDCDPMDINEMVVVLIPKINEPKDMTHFWPINLC